MDCPTRMARDGPHGVNVLDQIVPHLKAVHVGFMSIWMAGLLSLPSMLARHDRALGQADFERIRQATHYGYVWAITPAAALAIASGMALIFLRDVFVIWMFLKLVLVAGVVALHGWVGHTIVAVAETEGSHQPPRAFIPVLVLCALIAAILTVVLAKPDAQNLPLPGWLAQPLGNDLPFDVPSP